MKVDELATRLSTELATLVIGVNVVSPTCISITLDAEKLMEVAQKVNSIGFDHAKSVTAIDLPQDNKFDMVYHVSSFLDTELAKVILELKTSIAHDTPKISSLISVWPSIEYPERETLDLIGITFEGLPQKERLFLMDNFEGFPLRKDYKIKTEGIDA